MGKESLYPVQGSGVVFRDVFNTQTDTEHINNATVTGVDFSGGLATFGAGDSIVYGPVVPGVKSVRIKGVFSSLTTTLLTLSASHSVSVAAGTISATGFSSPTIYVDGAVSSTLTAGAHEIIVTTATAIEANTLEISSFEGDYDLLDLFRITLTATEVSLLAQNRLYQGLIKQGLVAYYDFTKGSSFDYSNNGNDGVDTDIIYKHGLGAKFNGSSSYISLANFEAIFQSSFSFNLILRTTDLSGTFVLLGATATGDNCRLSLRDNRLRFVYEANGNAATVADTLNTIFTAGLNQHIFISLTVDSTIGGGGAIKYYVDGSEIPLDAIKDGDTSGVTFSEYSNPINTFLMANNTAGTPSAYMSGIVKSVGIYRKVLSLTEITQNAQYFKQQGWI